MRYSTVYPNLILDVLQKARIANIKRFELKFTLIEN